MSGNLLEIKKKIAGVKNTRKITKAMQLVASSKMRQFQKRALSARSYVWGLLGVLQNNLDASMESPFTEGNPDGKVLFVLYTSDKGLCGSLNSKIINSLVRSEKWKALADDQRDLITVGRKSRDFANNNGIEILKSFTAVPEKLSTLDAIAVVDEIIASWMTGNYSEVIFVAPHYKNSFTFYPVMKTFLPFTEDTVVSTLGALDEDERPKLLASENLYMVFEPDEEIVLERLYEQLITSLFIQAFLELKASEYSSRMIAMQNATDAADRMISDLSRVYNKARQSAITQEIAELIGASMALEEEK